MDNLLRISFPASWLGSAALAGLLLFCSLPALASTQPKTAPNFVKPLKVASTTVAKESYPITVRNRLQWVTTPVNSQSDSAVKAASRSQAVVASVPQKQVSRSNNSTLVEHALSLQGTPYRFGGTTRNGFDCSGYSQYVFRGSDIYLPRTAADQFRVGTSVSKGELQAGDLVFFSTYGPGATHVGIYVGGGRFVSAANSGVSVSSLNSGYYASRYIGARRVR